MVIKILSKPFLKRKYCWSAFLIPIWGPIWSPRLPGSTKGAIFDIRFSKNVVFHIKIATPGGPNSTVQKQNISTFTGKKIICVTALVQILQLKAWRKLKNLILESFRIQIESQKIKCPSAFFKIIIRALPRKLQELLIVFLNSFLIPAIAHHNPSQIVHTNPIWGPIWGPYENVNFQTRLKILKNTNFQDVLAFW